MKDALVAGAEDWEDKYNRVKREAEKICRCFGLVKTHYLLGVCNVDEIELKSILWEEDFHEASPGVWIQETIRIGF